MELYEIVKKLTGPIEPVGKTETDDIRFKNLREHIDLVDNLISGLVVVSMNSERTEYSMKLAGEEAKKFLTELYHYLKNI